MNTCLQRIRARGHSPVRLVWWLCLAALYAASASGASSGAIHGHGLLWKVERPGDAPSYVFGTMHSTDVRVLSLPAAVRAALARSRSLTLEVDLNADTVERMRAAMRYRDGRELASVVGEALYRRCVRLMEEYGVGEARVRHMKPWAVLLTLSMPRPEGREFLDLRLYRQARQAGKPVYGLERGEEQVGYFEDMSRADQIALLRETVENHASLPRMFDELVRAYLAHDLAALSAINARYLEADDPALARRFMERLVYGRNRLMVRRMQPRLREGQAFIAVGALHLPGRDGILHLLEQRGYRVSPID